MKEKQASKDKGIMYKMNIPEGLNLEMNKVGLIKIKGAKGETTRQLMHPLVSMKQEESTIILATKSSKKKSKRMINSYHAHILNLFRGVKEGFTYKLKICSGHFPMTVKQEGEKIIISNFLGEKIPRIAKIMPGAKVKIDKDVITVDAPNVEAAGQTAANIEVATRIRGRDRRVFQDGIYITEKPVRTK